MIETVLSSGENEKALGLEAIGVALLDRRNLEVKYRSAIGKLHHEREWVDDLQALDRAVVDGSCICCKDDFELRGLAGLAVDVDRRDGLRPRASEEGLPSRLFDQVVQ